MEENPSFQMSGANCICSKAVIWALCDEASFLRRVDDISTMHSLRPALREIFVRQRIIAWRRVITRNIHVL